MQVWRPSGCAFGCPPRAVVLYRPRLPTPLWRRSLRDFRRRSKVPERRSGNSRSSLVIGQPCPQRWQHHVNTTCAVEIVCSGLTVPSAAHAGHLFGNRRNRGADNATSSKFSRGFHGSTSRVFNCGIIHTKRILSASCKMDILRGFAVEMLSFEDAQPWSSVRQQSNLLLTLALTYVATVLCIFF